MLTVFVADDSDPIRARLSTLIAEVGDAELIGEATNAQEVLDTIPHLKPDVLILDIRMPGGNGIQALDAIREVEVDPVVIILTAFPYPQYRRKCLESGADFFFDKSTEFEQVGEVLMELTRGQIGIRNR